MFPKSSTFATSTPNPSAVYTELAVTGVGFPFSTIFVSKLFSLVSLTKNIDKPEAILIKPAINTDFTFLSLAKVTINGAPMSPNIETASGMPMPLDLISGGKVSAAIR